MVDAGQAVKRPLPEFGFPQFLLMIVGGVLVVPMSLMPILVIVHGVGMMVQRWATVIVRRNCVILVSQRVIPTTYKWAADTLLIA